MARRKNLVASRKVTFTTTPQVWTYLEQLVGSGVYGPTPAQVARGFVERAVQELLGSRALRPLPEREAAGVRRAKKSKSQKAGGPAGA